ncbi:class I SAM-dependent methyltransferase [Alkalimonas sp.]|uniref:class I SAM-dependent methyltransferase n=1 Tax=Alkalimonas sp. TaxID=1872453 RepID=UPI00263BC433|nr:class I SAM-dependent methyltransferase [Alkalimonas sp.]MCC5827453.1 class I SAM-dependent methyltransferase [Alkalimonas sp.]
MSVNFYNQNAARFVQDTVKVEMAALYDQFLPYLNQGAHIVDAGCGSGRDTLFFQQQGFQVTAFDASDAMVAAARELTNGKVLLSDFNDFSSPKPVDAIWACASLLHVPAANLPHTFKHLANQLKPAGFFYCSFKQAESDSERDGRHFTNMTEQRLRDMLKDTSLQVLKCWTTSDLRPGRERELWLNALLEKSRT